MQARHLLAAGVAAAAVVVVSSCSPTEPSPAPALTSIRYVRTYPVKGTAEYVALNYVIPIRDDPYHRSRISTVALRSVDDSTFVYDYPNNFSDIPADTECTFSVQDQAVSAYSVARDIYVNGTRIRVELAGNYEYGHFKVTEDGKVY